jgi:hypothetical protein
VKRHLVAELVFLTEQLAVVARDEDKGLVEDVVDCADPFLN